MFTKLFFNKNFWVWYNVAIACIPISLLFSPVLSSVILILVFFISVITKGHNRKRPRVNKVVFFAYSVFLFLHLFGLLYSEDLNKAFSLIIRRLPLLILFFIFWNNYDRINKKLIIKIYFFGVLSVCFFTFCNALYSLYLNQDSLDILFKYYNRFFYVSFMPYELHPTYFGLFIAIALALNFNFLWKRELLIFNLFSFLLLILNLFLLSSQMIVFTCIIIAIIFILHFIRQRSGKLGYNLLIFSALIMIGVFYLKGDVIVKSAVQKLEINSKSNIIYRVAHFFESGDITRRKNWQSAISVIEDNFLFGVGLGDGVSEMQHYREQNTWIYRARLNAHNQYLEEFLHFGLLGFSSLIIFLGGMFILNLRNPLHLAIIAVFLLVMCTESILNRQVGITLFSFFLPLLLFKNKC